MATRRLTRVRLERRGTNVSSPSGYGLANRSGLHHERCRCLSCKQLPTLLGILLCVLGCSAPAAASAQASGQASYTHDQAQVGEGVYLTSCAACHLPDL